MTLEICERVLRKVRSLGVEEVAVAVDAEVNTMVRFARNSITAVKTWDSTNISLYLIRDGKRFVGSFEYSEGVDDLDALIRRAVDALEFAKRVDWVRNLLPEARPLSYIPSRRNLEDLVKPEPLVEISEDGVGAALKEGVAYVSGVVRGDVLKRSLITSTGFMGEYSSGFVEANFRSFASEDASGQAVAVSVDPKGMMGEELGIESAGYAKESNKLTSWEPGSYSVVLTPQVFANLIDDVVRAASALMVDMGMSFLCGKLGNEVAPEWFSLLDDPKNEDGAFSRPFDDEGVETRVLKVIENGVLKNYLHNSYTAKKMKVNSTGNAGWIAPTPSNIVVSAGEVNLEEMIGDVHEGFLVNSNWYTRFQNRVTGDFSTLARDAVLKINEGEVIGAVKGVRLSYNMNKFLENIEAATKDRRWVKWWEVPNPTLCPYVRIDGVNLTRAQA
ncbi:MAG: TldD/PmbA family protein [Candidatus Bathyarchaeia archaeon]